MAILPFESVEEKPVETTDATESVSEVSEGTDSSTDVSSEEAPEAQAKETQSPEGESHVGKEKPADTVRRALRDLEKNGGKNAEAPKEEAKKAEPPKEDLTKEELEKAAKELELDPDLMAPERLTAIEKQMFNNLPKGLKRAFSKSVKNLQSMTSREKEEYSRLTQENRGIQEAVQPYLTKWGERGFTAPSAIAALAAAQEKLTNPQTREATFIALGQDIGIDWERITQVARGEASPQPAFSRPADIDIENHPKFRALQEQVSSLYSNHEQQVVEPHVAEMKAVQEEIDPATGDYRYPELHNDSYLLRLKPLVTALIETVPNLTAGEALRRAHLTAQGKQVGAFGQQAQTRLPATSNNLNNGLSQPARAVSAAVTVRGKTTPVAVGNGLPVNPPPEALRSARETTKWVHENLKNGTVS